jgi:hypothetical protein
LEHIHDDEDDDAVQTVVTSRTGDIQKSRSVLASSRPAHRCFGWNCDAVHDDDTIVHGWFRRTAPFDERNTIAVDDDTIVH